MKKISNKEIFIKDYCNFGKCFFKILDIFKASQILVHVDKNDSTSFREQNNLFSLFSL